MANEKSRSEQNNVIKALQNWLEYQHHLPSFIDDTILNNFLAGCKNNVETAKSKLDYYYSYRRRFPEFYTNRNPRNEEIQRSVSNVACSLLPLHTTDGYNVTVTKIIDHNDLDKLDVATMIKRLLMIVDLRLMVDRLPNGEIIVHDCAGLTIQHITNISINVVRNYAIVAQSCLPMRFKGVILINVPTYMETLLKIIRTFMKEKMKERIHVYSGGYENLYNHVPKEILPRDYGGDLDVTISDINDLWYGKLLEHESWFADDNYMMSDETKMTKEQIKFENEYFGCNGTFKQITFD